MSLRMQCQMMVIQGISRNEVNVTLSGMKKERQRECIGFQWRRGGVWEKKGLTCYEYDAECIRPGEYYQ